MTHRQAFLLALALLAAAAACHGPEKARSSAGPALELEPAPPPRDWTHAFQKEAVLVAEELTIEGPPDLVDHIVLQPDPETGVYSTKTVPQGLLQELVQKPDSHVELRAQLDAWSLAAFRKITVLQRPGEVPVTVRASGDAYFAPAGGGPERRQAELVFRGTRGQ